jgi:hypothetical protein
LLRDANLCFVDISVPILQVRAQGFASRLFASEPRLLTIACPRDPATLANGRVKLLSSFQALAFVPVDGKVNEALEVLGD